MGKMFQKGQVKLDFSKKELYYQIDTALNRMYISLLEQSYPHDHWADYADHNDQEWRRYLKIWQQIIDERLRSEY